MGPIDHAAFAAVAHLIDPRAVPVKLTLRLLLGGYAAAPTALLEWEAFAVGPALRPRHAREGDADLVDRAVRIPGSAGPKLTHLATPKLTHPVVQ